MKPTLKDEAYTLIKRRIITCEYRPNTFLNEADLIADLDASRTPIREALNKLEQEGFVEILPKKGVMVTGLTLSEINQTFEARILLEPFIVENYMDRIDKDALQEILTASEHLLVSSPAPRNTAISMTICTGRSARPARTSSLSICWSISMIRTNASACSPARTSGSGTSTPHRNTLSSFISS